MIGKAVSHYKILQHLGGGGMGVVYKALDLKLDRPVALKFLPPDLTRDPDAKARFIHEAKAASALQHTNICVVHDIDETEDGQMFISMEYLEGETVKKKLEQGPLTIAEAVTIAMQIAHGLQKAHEHGIVHRDIKPANVMVTNDGVAKLIDFGLAKLSGRTAMTKAGSFMGTVGYMSPEQIQGSEVDRRTDIFSLGVLLYEMLSGRGPFQREYEAAALYAIIHDHPRPLTELREDVPAGVQSIVSRALSKNPDERYQSMADMLHDLHGGECAGGAPGPSAHTKHSIAVLPFEDMSSGHDQEFFCDGVAEELINALSHISSFRVIARSSAFAFKGRNQDVRTIGRSLGVQTLLEGSVRKADNRLRVTVQLINAEDGSNLWSERYDRNLDDIFAIQDDICLSIAERLKTSLPHQERNQVVNRRAQDASAYNLYLKGRFLFNQRKETSIKKSVECYDEAISIDPAFGLAYAGLAASYEILGSRRWLPQSVAYSKAREAAMTALHLNDTLPESHIALGSVKMNCDWDWPAAEREFCHALVLNPAHADAHHMYAHYLEVTGRFDEALGHMDRALALEPVSPSLASCAAQVFFSARRYEEAIHHCNAAMELAPGFFGLFGWLGIAHVQAGSIERGIAAIETGLQHLPEDARLLALMGYACARAGRQSRAIKCLDTLSALRAEKYVDSYFVVWPHAALGDATAACGILERAFDEHSEWLPWVKVDPLMDGLRADPRFVTLLDRLGFRA